MRRFAIVVVLALGALIGCHSDPQPTHPAAGELPPLPPASGTPVGYLLDSSGDLKLRDDQLTKLKQIDASLAQNADLDVQIRQIERPEEDEPVSPQEMKAGKKPARHNHAPGAAMKTTADSAKLHAIEKENDKVALKQAWAILDPDQQATAKKILDDRGVEVPGATAKREKVDDSDGKPLPDVPLEP
jgi:hypothetical protein